jgi:hypothetical protein
MRKPSVLCFYLLLLIAFTTKAQTTDHFSVCGSIHDATGSLIPGATVTLSASGSPAVVAAAQSDPDGAFVVATPAPGTYVLRVDENGFASYEAPVVVTVSRRFSVKDSRSLEFRAEAFNVLNHAQFFGAAAVEGNISSGSFGQAVSAMPPRLAQLAARFQF